MEGEEFLRVLGFDVFDFGYEFLADFGDAWGFLVLEVDDVGVVFVIVSLSEGLFQ